MKRAVSWIVCALCKDPKPADEFHNDASSVTGKTNHCKECQREYRKIHSAKKKKS